MLNYWRTTGGAATPFTGISAVTSRPAAATNPLTSAAGRFSDYGFDGPFFDLEFALSNHIDNNDVASDTASGELSESDEELREIELDLDVGGRDFEISPFQKRRFQPPSSDLSNIPEGNSKLPVSLLKSAAKFPILLLNLKKPDSPNGGKIDRSKKIDSLRVKFKVDAAKGPLISLFARDYTISERNSPTNSVYLGRETMQKYLSILKPLYVGVEKMKSSSQLRFHGGGRNCGGALSPPPEMAKARSRSSNLQAGIKVVRKHFRSSSGASAASSPPAKVGCHRREDSMVQDGIQGAILYCKRSFNSNSNREGELSGCDSNCEKLLFSSCTGKV